MTDTVTRIRDVDVKGRLSVLETQIDYTTHSLERIEGKVETQYNTIHSRISDMRDDFHKEMNEKHTTLIEKLDEQGRQSTDQHASLSKKVSDMEKWRWMVMGGAIVLGYVLAHIKLEKFF
jgi:DNA anti-recombination protein RmuC